MDLKNGYVHIYNACVYMHIYVYVYVYVWNIIQWWRRMKSCHLWHYGWVVEGIMLSEISQRKSVTIWLPLHVDSETKQNNNKGTNKAKQTHRHGEQTGGC